MKSVLYLYLSRKTGQFFDSTGFRLPGDIIPASEIGNPFENIDIDAVEEPPYIKQTAKDFYRLNDRRGTNPQAHYIKLSEQQLMQCCNDFNGSPNALLAVILARTARRYDSESEKSISVAIAIDHKAILLSIGIKYEIPRRESLSLCGIKAFKSPLNESHGQEPCLHTMPVNSHFIPAPP